MMKSLSILAAASLALAPALAGAGSIGDNSVAANGESTSANRPISGPVAGHYLKNEEIPAGAIVVGALVILGGVLIGALASGGGSDSNNNTNNANN